MHYIHFKIRIRINLKKKFRILYRCICSVRSEKPFFFLRCFGQDLLYSLNIPALGLTAHPYPCALLLFKDHIVNHYIHFLRRKDHLKFLAAIEPSTSNSVKIFIIYELYPQILLVEEKSFIYFVMFALQNVLCFHPYSRVLKLVTFQVVNISPKYKLLRSPSPPLHEQCLEIDLSASKISE